LPWKETCVMNEREAFLRAWELGEQSRARLCREFGISRKTAYQVMKRVTAEGPAGLAPRSRAPHSHPNRTPQAVVAAVLRAKRAHPDWGPRKLQPLPEDRAWLGDTWPAPSTIGDILAAHALVTHRRRRRHSPAYTDPLSHAQGPNDVWCIDFKGWFRTADGRRCDPFTVTDAYSRMALGCDIIVPRTEPVWHTMERHFRTYGLPLAIRSDNGPPFASVGAGGLSPLSVRWVKLGIRPERIAPGHPEQNGRHERFHRTLKQATAMPPAATVRQQQQRFDEFRQEYNLERPHEALGQRPPASTYRPSPRPYPRALQEPVYEDDLAIRRVRSNGQIKWHGHLIFISEPLIGEPVGVLDAGTAYEVFYGPLFLGQIDLSRTRLVHPPVSAGDGHTGAPV